MKPIKILFANIPFDGHFSPLTSLAIYLKNQGHDVRWYTGSVYVEKIRNLNVPYFPFKKAIEYNQYNLDQVFAERLRHKGQVSRLRVDLKNAFILRTPEFFEDIKEIHKSFPFDVMIADVMFTAVPLVKEKLGKPVISVGVLPLIETSKDLAPAGLGMTPSATFWGRKKQDLLRYVTDHLLFGESHQLYRKILNQYGVHTNDSLFDALVRKATIFLQSGTPGFEYKRSDLGKNIRFIGALLPAPSNRKQTFDFNKKLSQYKKVILITQGTVEKDPAKLIIPTLEAFKNSNYLVIATTGGSKTKELREKYPQANIVVEDFIPFNDIMPYADVYITNGGYGGVMLSIENKLPMVVAGIHEGKNEINARVEYFKLGINLNTESPKPKQVKEAVLKVLQENTYRINVEKMSEEFRQYNPQMLTEKYLYEILQKSDYYADYGKQLEMYQKN